MTADCVDPLYANPVIDSEQDLTTPVAHHRVSGHFEGTDIRFNIYLPPASQWKGRFFQYTYPTAFTPRKTRRSRTTRHRVLLASGGYTVQAGNAGNSVGYRHAAAAAKFAETVAADYYAPATEDLRIPIRAERWLLPDDRCGREHLRRVGGVRAHGSGVPMSAPYTFFIRAMARLVLADKAEQIADAVRPGGSGEPYAGLDKAERTMLTELTRVRGSAPGLGGP